MTEVHCDCSQIPPTMPTCRSEHLYDCPVAVVQRWQKFEAARIDGTLDVEFAPVKAAMQSGDLSTVAAWLNRDAPERGRAAYLRSRANSAAPRNKQHSPEGS